MKSNFWFVIYAMVGLAVVGLSMYQWDYPLIYGALKGALMPLLIGFVLSNMRQMKCYLTVVLALIFSWVGDILLLFADTEPYFVLGLAAFLIAQISYFIGYTKAMDKNFEPLIIRKYPLLIPLLAAIPMVLLRVLNPYLGDLLLPVILYSGALLIMTTGAVSRYGKTSLQSFLLVTVGAFVFLLSDSLIALDRFMNNIPFSPILVMSTYILAQGLIVRGLWKHGLGAVR
jgi:uncharacterized membrane protein YhhN